MNNYPASTVGITYQFVVVAVVACGIFSAGVITVMYRRRRRLRAGGGGYVDDDPDGATGRLGDTHLVLERGVFVERSVKRKSVGPVPTLWEVQLGAHEEDRGRGRESEESEGKEWDDGEVGLNTETQRVQTEWDDDVRRWKPTSLTLPPHPQADVEITLLLALPDPALHFDPANPDTYAPPPHPHLHHAEDVDVPPLILGITSLLVENAAQLDCLRPPPPPIPVLGKQKVRVDGFSRGLLRI